MPFLSSGALATAGRDSDSLRFTMRAVLLTSAETCRGTYAPATDDAISPSRNAFLDSIRFASDDDEINSNNVQEPKDKKKIAQETSIEALFRFCFPSPEGADRFWSLLRSEWCAPGEGRSVRCDVRCEHLTLPDVKMCNLKSVSASHCLLWVKRDAESQGRKGFPERLVVSVTDACGASIGALSRAIAEDRSLTHALDLLWSGLGDATVLQISRALAQSETTLRVVDLGYNSIGPEGALALASALGRNRTLRELCVSYNGIGSAGAVAIFDALKRSNRTLRVVDVSSCGIDDEGGAAVADCLLANDALLEVRLSGNSMTSESAFRIARSLGANGTLTDLDIGSNYVDNDGMFAINRAVAQCGPVPVPLTGGQRIAFLMGKYLPTAPRNAAPGKGVSPVRRLPLDVIKRILLCYKVRQGKRVFSFPKQRMSIE